MRTLAAMTGLGLLLFLPLHAVATPAPPLTLHDDADAAATVQIADCVFWVRGHGVAHASGTVEVHENRGRGGSVILATLPYEGRADGHGGYDFVAGPFEVDASGHVGGMRVFARVTGGDAWSETAHVHCGAPYTECVDDLRAEALSGGDVRLTWSASANATGYRVLRNDGTQNPAGRPEWEPLGETQGTTFVDTTSEAGQTYTYDVIALGERQVDACPTIQVAAVPFFGATLGALAVGTTLGAYAWMRRRT